MLLTLFVTIYFQSSSRLTNAYGLTVCSVSVITTIMFMMLIKSVWKKSLIHVIFFGLFLIIDCLFWSANVLKFLEGLFDVVKRRFCLFFSEYRCKYRCMDCNINCIDLFFNWLFVVLWRTKIKKISSYSMSNSFIK